MRERANSLVFFFFSSYCGEDFFDKATHSVSFSDDRECVIQIAQEGACVNRILKACRRCLYSIDLYMGFPSMCNNVPEPDCGAAFNYF